MVEYEKLYDIVKNALSEKRFRHSEGVVKRALEYAEIYDVDKETVKCVAIAHDIAKELPENDVKTFIERYSIDLDEIEKNNKNLIHAKVGAYICKNKFNFTDDMANSVMYHTTGRANMSLLEKVIYLADATDENRGYEDINYYVDLVKKNIDDAMVQVSKWVIGHLLENEMIIHPDSIECYNYYLKNR